MSKLAISNGMITEFGGFASKFWNRTGSTIVHGSAVSCSTTHDRAVILQNNEFDCIGVAYGDIPHDTEGWVVTAGIGEALFENGNAPVRGNWVKAAVTDGRVNAAVTPAGISAVAASEHFREVGHCLESKSSGTDVRALVVIHPL